MHPETFACPQCRAALRRPSVLAPGDPVSCPRCGNTFPFPALAEAVPATAALPASATASTETPAKPDGTPRFPEQLPPVEESEERANHLRRSFHRPIDSDLPICRSSDIPEWFRYARVHWSHFGGIAAFFCWLSVFLCALFCLLPPSGPFLALLLVPLLHTGLSIVALAQLKGMDWSFGDFFAGLYWWRAIFGITFSTVLLCLLLLPLGIFLALGIDLFNGVPVEPEPLGFALGFGLPGLLVFLYLYTRLITFALPLAIDRRYGALEALGRSWDLTRGHFWPLLGLHLLLGLINVAGALCFLMGLFFTLPFTTLVWNAGYLLVAGTRPPVLAAGPSWRDGDRYDSV
jgi:hypothetical protein